MSHSGEKCFILALTAALSLSAGAISHAQAVESEPNDSCSTAQEVGSIELPYALNGTLEESAETEIDFFRFAAPAGIELEARLRGAASGAGTLGDPFVGWFDSSCELRELNDDSFSLDSRLVLTVPADGVFVLAASSCCDYAFEGTGGSRGSYELGLVVAPPRIGSIAAQAMDALAGVPLSGDAPPYASFELMRCSDGDCSEYLAFQPADSDGRVTFSTAYNGDPLRVGTYRIEAYANDYERAVSEPFAVGAGEHVDIGPLFLDPPPVSISDIEPCDTLPASGGTCRYRAEVNNNTGEPMRGIVWSVVDGFGPDLAYTLFEASATGRSDVVAARRPFRFGAFDGGVFEFGFTVPALNGEYAEFCARMFVGRQPDPLFDPAQQSFLFCVTQTSDGSGQASGRENGKAMSRLGRGRDPRHPHETRPRGERVR